MTRVCILGADDADLRVDLLAYETARGALGTYDLDEPYANVLCIETISLGAAVSLLNDLNWYLARLAEAAIIFEPSVSETEWLSRDLAAAIRSESIPPAESDEFLTVYGVVEPVEGRPYLVEPMYVRRVGTELPTYDLHDVDDTLVVRVTAAEFGG